MESTNRQGFHTNAFFSQRVSSVLEAFLNDDAGPFQGCARCLHNLNEALERASVSQEIINNEHMVFRLQEFF